MRSFLPSIIIGVLIGLAGNAAIAIAWTGPTATAPSSNISAPLNVGTTAQVKNGNVGVNTFTAFGDIRLAGGWAPSPSTITYLNFSNVQYPSTPTWGSSGYGIRDNNGTIEFKNSGGSWASFNTAVQSYLSLGSVTQVKFSDGTTQTTAAPGGTGSTGYLPKYSGASTLANSQIYESSYQVSVGTTTQGATLYVNTRPPTYTGGSGPVYSAIFYNENLGGYGVFARADSGTAMYGYSAGASGRGGYFYGAGAGGVGVRAIGGGAGGYGVYGSTDAGNGVYGVSGGGYGVYGNLQSTGGATDAGVYGFAATAVDGAYGVRGTAAGTGSYGVYCTGTTCGGTKAWTNTSDVRLKKDIATLSDGSGLSAIMKLRPVTYHWRDANDDKNNGEQLGFIAQEIEEVFPQLVTTDVNPAEITDENGETVSIDHPKTMSYGPLVAPLVKAVQELKAENDALRADFEAYKAAHP